MGGCEAAEAVAIVEKVSRTVCWQPRGDAFLCAMTTLVLGPASRWMSASGAFPVSASIVLVASSMNNAAGPQESACDADTLALPSG